MTGTNKTPELESREVADASRKANTTELSPEDLSKVSGGQGCAAGVHYSSVTISMRKAGGDTQGSGA